MSDSSQSTESSFVEEQTGPQRYMPKLSKDDPVCTSIARVCGAIPNNIELLDSRWNGNEVFRYDLDPSAAQTLSEEDTGADRHPRTKVFVKMNRVESPTVFMSEAVSLTMLVGAADSVVAPKPIHIGKLPRVGDYGPGAFMLLDWYDLAAFGAFRSEVQKNLAHMVADIHVSQKLDHVHLGRFGFTTNNYLALTPQDNSWMADWPSFFAKRLTAQVNAAYKNKVYGRAPLSTANEQEASLKPLTQRITSDIGKFFDGCEVKPSLLHGDLWIGNVGATKNSTPVIFDPACFFGHSEFDLALMRMFGGYTDDFWNAYFDRLPKSPGFDARAPLYELFQYLNQLNLFGDPQVKDKILALANDLVAFLDRKPIPEK